MTEPTQPTSSNQDQTAQADTGGATPKTRHKRKVAIITLSSIFLLIGLVWFVYWLIWGRFEIYTDDAYVNGNMVQLMAQVPGTVIEINTDDTQLVTQGQTVIKLDPADTNIALQHAKATLAQTVRQVRQAFINAERAQNIVILRNADLMKAQLDLKRRTGLVGENAVSREEFQHYKTAAEAAQAQYDYALHSLHAAQALVENSHLYTHPLVERAKANLRTAYLNAQRTTIVSPVTGYVAKRSVQVGQHVSLNTPMLAIVPLNEIWVDANYKESQLNRLRIGQPVILYADAYPDVTFHGIVFGLNVGTGAAFSLLPPQNATGNWIKIVQRLPVRIVLNPAELKKQPLQLGLSMRVTTNIHDLSGHKLAQKAENKSLYTTDVYASQLAKANELIASILRDNSPDMYLPRTAQND
jgi:membrane fusion protein, multidrug efflux system